MEKLELYIEKDYINTHFQKRITFLMKYFGLSKTEVARKAKIARSTFYRYLSGDIQVSENAAYRLGKVFHSDSDVFAKSIFQIAIENPELNTFDVKLCQWKERDDCFQILDEVEDSPNRYPDFDESINYPYARKLTSASLFPISSIFNEASVKTTTTLNKRKDNNSEKDSDNDISEYIPQPHIYFCEDDQFYDLLNDLIKIFEKNPSDKFKIFSKLYTFTKKLKEEYPDLENLFIKSK